MDEEVSEKIKKIEERLDTLESTVKTMVASHTEKEQATMSALLALPSNLQRTLLAVQELEEATSSIIAEQVKQSKSTQNLYLNQLTRLGFLSKERKGHKIYFRVLEKKRGAIRRWRSLLGGRSS